jgi:hypothetical protein
VYVDIHSLRVDFEAEVCERMPSFWKEGRVCLLDSFLDIS